MTTPDFWTEERIERLGELWGAGLSAAKIGREIGCTKNAVISKAHRLGLSARPSPIKRDGPSYVRPRRPSRRAPSLPLPSLDPMPKQIDALPPAITAQSVSPVYKCQWIEGHRPFTAGCFCGKPTLIGIRADGGLRISSWCPAHYARVYRTPSAGGTAPALSDLPKLAPVADQSQWPAAFSGDI